MWSVLVPSSSVCAGWGSELARLRSCAAFVALSTATVRGRKPVPADAGICRQRPVIIRGKLRARAAHSRAASLLQVYVVVVGPGARAVAER